jgi:4-coumarate--CoA ligase (photoactive yellow protein activation family)
MRREALLRVVRDVLAHRITQVRGSAWGTHLGWATDRELQAAVGVDSIELVEAATDASALFLLERPGWEDYLLRDRTLEGWAAVAHAALAETGALRFRSSGSRGERHEHVHRLASLQAEALHFASLLRAPGVVRTAVPTHHIYGFIFGVLLPEAVGVATADYCGRMPTTLLREVVEGDVVVAHPMVWQALAALDVRWPARVTGVTSTAPCPPDTIHRLRHAGLSRMIEVYGSSETAGIGWRDEPGASFRLLPGWRLSADGMQLCAEDGRMATLPDHVQVDADRGGVTPVGRLDDAVQVAGHNVHPARVAERLRGHPGVAAAAVRLDSTRARLKAYIVPEPGCMPSADELRAWCMAALPDAAVPARFDFGAALPRNVMGKDADWA